MFDLGDGLAVLTDLPAPLVVAVAGALALSECTLGVGLLVPGDSALFLAGATASTPFRFVLMTAVVAGCAAGGDLIGYGLGHRFGPRMRETRLIARLGHRHWDRAAEMLRRHGGGAVFTARFLPLVRTLAPAAAGASGLPLSRFLPASLLGAVCWSTLHIGLGSVAGASATYVEDVLGRASWILFGLVLALPAGTALWKRLRKRSTPDHSDTTTEHSLLPREKTPTREPDTRE
ncbi:membrane protein DedA with SNARE-associated domain [Actinopolyspora biskrensis]|uniref:Membrane protein DedA with SNARE-associated domain n=1 Tax=Actinopolyspora biskrensis TaxID=1470178 RepID=A0A852YUT1_9ACTN|nr:DedA family protein [Actinopolyspora biskrensis]NYH77492.1 membrane protein DedA with SNARE-associated domain [Actinopolyspora biskrensis]